MRNPILKEEIVRIQEIMFGGVLEQKPLVLEKRDPVAAMNFLRKFTQDMGEGSMKWTKNPGEIKRMNNFYSKWEKKAPHVFETVEGILRPTSWDDLLDYIFADEPTRDVFLRSFFNQTGVQRETINYIKTEYKTTTMGTYGSEKYNIRKFVDEILDTKNLDNIFSQKFKNSLDKGLSLTRTTLGAKVINKIDSGDFAGVRDIIGYFNPGHKLFLETELGRIPFLYTKGGKGHKKWWKDFIMNQLRAAWGIANSPLALTRLGFNKMVTSFGQRSVAGVFKGFSMMLLGGLTIQYGILSLNEVLGGKISQLISNGGLVYKSSSPTAREYFGIDRSKSVEIAKFIHDELDDTFVNEKVILKKLLESGSRFGLCQVAYDYERLYTENMGAAINTGTAMVGNLEKYVPRGVGGIKDYNDILRGLMDKEKLPVVKLNEKNSGVFDSIGKVEDIPNNQSLYIKGPLVVENGTVGIYDTSGAYMSVEVLLLLSEYFLRKSPTYEDSDFKSDVEKLSRVDAETALSMVSGNVLYIPGEMEMGKFKPSEDMSTIVSNDNRSAIRADLQDMATGAVDLWDRALESIQQ